eukprot:TRINITY_DN23653_c0_g1_i1.p1 TRINITY_DN23653_c0_g1~~TRINITY_DN23653_c0_g1_i1.p1  ORF type:complete len:305 (+),score=74.62 TRINITY_DN23653_c0_g1_i1:426-1340(+)
MVDFDAKVERKPRLTMGAGCSIATNVASSVGLILVNKQLVFNVAQFHFGTALTIIHFACTFLICLGAGFTGFFELRRLPLFEVLKISVAFCGYVLFQNLSLAYNSIGFYQIMKIANTPTILLLERLLFGRQQPLRVLWSLSVVCLGIFVAVFTDTQLNLVGTAFALLAVVFNSLYTIWGKSKMTELACGPAQLLVWQSGVSAVLLLVPLCMENLAELLRYEVTVNTVTGIGISSCLAALVNFSFFWMVGETSAITTNVMGYVKTVGVFVGGFVLFRDTLTFQNVSGIMVTLFGVAVYTWAKGSA